MEPPKPTSYAASKNALAAAGQSRLRARPRNHSAWLMQFAALVDDAAVGRPINMLSLT